MSTTYKDVHYTNGIPNHIETKAVREKVESETFKKMLDMLSSLLDHNHYFRDHYGTACQCQCQCQCQCRGVV